MRKYSFVVLLALVILAIPALTSAGQIVDHSSVLTGAVLPQGLVQAGQVVRQGDVIVMVDTIAGAAPAARANVNGRVVEVLVKGGDIIRVGQIVARIEAQ